MDGDLNAIPGGQTPYIFPDTASSLAPASGPKKKQDKTVQSFIKSSFASRETKTGSPNIKAVRSTGAKISALFTTSRINYLSSSIIQTHQTRTDIHKLEIERAKLTFKDLNIPEPIKKRWAEVLDGHAGQAEKTTSSKIDETVKAMQFAAQILLLEELSGADPSNRPEAIQHLIDHLELPIYFEDLQEEFSTPDQNIIEIYIHDLNNLISLKKEAASFLKDKYETIEPQWQQAIDEVTTNPVERLNDIKLAIIVSKEIQEEEKIAHEKLDTEDIEPRPKAVSDLIDQLVFNSDHAKEIREYRNKLRSVDFPPDSATFFSPADEPSIVHLSNTTLLSEKGGFGNLDTVQAKLSSPANQAAAFTDKEYVIKSDKELTPDQPSREEYFKYKEFRRLLTMDELPYFVPLVGDKEMKSDATPDAPFIYMMEKFEGDLTTAEDKSPKQKESISSDLIIALDIIIEKGCILMDIKSENMLHSNAEGVICDFGSLFNYRKFLENPTKEELEKFINSFSFTPEATSQNDLDEILYKFNEVYDNYDRLTTDELKLQLIELDEQFIQFQQFSLGVALYQMATGNTPYKYLELEDGNITLNNRIYKGVSAEKYRAGLQEDMEKSGFSPNLALMVSRMLHPEMASRLSKEEFSTFASTLR